MVFNYNRTESAFVNILEKTVKAPSKGEIAGILAFLKILLILSYPLLRCISLFDSLFAHPVTPSLENISAVQRACFYVS